MAKLSELIQYLCDRGGHVCLFQGTSSYGDGGDLSWEAVGRFIKVERDYSGSIVAWYVSKESESHPCKVIISPEAEPNGRAFEAILVHGKWSLAIGIVAGSEKGRFSNELGDVTEVSNQENARTCSKCGKVMRSTSGKTLHEKTCPGN